MADPRTANRRLPTVALAAGLLVAAAVVVLVLTGPSSDSAGEASAPRSFFGVVPQGPLAPEDYARMEQGGVGTLRTLLAWPAVDPTAAEGDFDWSAIDAIVAGATARGIEVLPFLYGSPQWAAELDGSDCVADACSPVAPSSEPALAAWRTFVGAAVERYGAGGEFWRDNPTVPEVPIRAWQIWNEQNSPTFYRPRPDIDAYARLLEISEEAIHERDPEAEVVLGGMFGTPLDGRPPAYTAWDYLDRLYEIEGIEDRFDGVGAHPYAARMAKVTSQVELMREAIERAGDESASLWITEVGWASGGPENPLNRGAEGQAESLTQAFEYFAERREAWRIETVTWFSWRDYHGPGLCDWCPESGLFSEDSLKPKPSWEAFTALSGGS